MGSSSDRYGRWRFHNYLMELMLSIFNWLLYALIFKTNQEGNETVTNCHALKMTAADGKQRLTDVADTEQLLRLIQSIPCGDASFCVATQ